MINSKTIKKQRRSKLIKKVGEVITSTAVLTFVMFMTLVLAVASEIVR